MDNKCSKCSRPGAASSSKKDAPKAKRNCDSEKAHKQECVHKTASKHSADKLGCSCKRSRSQVRMGVDSPVRADLKKSKSDVKVDVSSIYAETTSSGGINIPVKLIVSVKKSRKEIIPCGSPRCLKVFKPPVDLVYNSCTIHIYCDPYINEMAELNDKFYSLHATKAGVIKSRTTTGIEEIICPPGTNSYIEQYTLVGYTDQTQENVGIQTDLVLGPQLESQSLESIKEPEPERSQSGDTCTCATTQTNTKYPVLPWAGLILPGHDTYHIEAIDKAKLDDTVDATIITNNNKNDPNQKPTKQTPPPKKEGKKKKKGISSCSPCCYEDDYEPPRPESPVPDPEPEILFVYNRHCNKTEPYIYQLVEYSSLQFVVPKEMSWGTIEMPTEIVIRLMTKCICKPAPMPMPMRTPTLTPRPMLQLLEVQSTVCKMISAPTSRSHMLSPKISVAKCNSCGSKFTKSAGAQISLSKHSVSFKGSATKSKSGSCRLGIPPRIELLYKNKSDNFCPPCNKAVSLSYGPCQTEDPVEYFAKPDPVDTALQAFEAELKPMKTTLNMLQQKLKNLNMPELDFMFNKPQVAIQQKVTQVTKINLSESIKLLYCPNKKPLKTQRFGRVSSHRKSKSKLSRSKSRSRSRSRSCSRCPSTASCQSKTTKKGKSRSSKYRKGKSRKRFRKGKGGSSSSSSGSNRSASRSSSCDSCKHFNKIVLRSNTKSTASSLCSCSAFPSTSASAARPKSKTRVKSFRIRAKNYSKAVSRTSSETSVLSECPFLEAIKSILVDRQKITQQDCGKNKTQNIENIRMHVRLQPRKKKR